MVARSYVMQSTEDNRSFLWHKQVNHYITAILQILVYTLRKSWGFRNESKQTPMIISSLEGTSVPTCPKT